MLETPDFAGQWASSIHRCRFYHCRSLLRGSLQNHRAPDSRSGQGPRYPVSIRPTIDGRRAHVRDNQGVSSIHPRANRDFFLDDGCFPGRPNFHRHHGPRIRVDKSSLRLRCRVFRRGCLLNTQQVSKGVGRRGAVRITAKGICIELDYLQPIFSKSSRRDAGSIARDPGSLDPSIPRSIPARPVAYRKSLSV